MENNLKSLIREFKVIKDNLQPAIAEMKKIRELDIEFRKFKNDIYSQIKKVDFETRRLSAQKAGVIDTKRIEEVEKELQQRLALVNRQIDEYRAKVRQSSKEEFGKIKTDQRMHDTSLGKSISELDKKHIELHSSNREMIASIISEFNYFKKDFEKQKMDIEKNTRTLEELDKWFKERDKEHTKEMNTRKRHINQIAAELSDARHRDHLNAVEVEANKHKFDELKNNVLKASNEIDNLNKIIKKKVDDVKISDLTLNFSRLEKKTTTEVGEVKGRMRELERRIVGRKEIENLQKEMTILNTKFVNKNDVDQIQTNLIEKFRQEINVLNERLSNIARDENVLNLLKKEIAVLKAESDNFRQVISKIPDVPTKDQFEYMKDVVTKLKHDVDASTDLAHMLKRDLAASIGKIEEVHLMKEPMKSLKNDFAALGSKLNADVDSIRKELDRINIKVDNTSKLLKELDKVL